MYLSMTDLFVGITNSHLEEFTELPAEDIATIFSHAVMGSILGGSVLEASILEVAYGSLQPFFIKNLGGMSPIPVIRLSTDQPIKN